MIGILNYGAGNLRSIENALDRIGAPYFISDKPEELSKTGKIIFPGVGHAKAAMAILHDKKLDIFLQKYPGPVLGICLGMQLLFEYSEEGDTDCLGFIPGKILKFDSQKCGKVPHMGWNNINLNVDSLFVYFVHSYYAPISTYTIATCNYGGEFTAAVQKENFIGMQFHPEKSGKVGEDILRNFCSI